MPAEFCLQRNQVSENSLNEGEFACLIQRTTFVTFSHGTINIFSENELVYLLAPWPLPHTVLLGKVPSVHDC